jgi:uncharacterized membrane protein
VSERTVRAAIGGLSLLGAAIASYLLVADATGARIACPVDGCETVQSSPYAEIAGLPVAGLGLAGFLAILATAVARGEPARAGGVALGLGAFGFSAYLVGVQLLVIGAVCAWCIASDAIVTAMATLTLVRVRVAAAPDAATAENPQRTLRSSGAGLRAGRDGSCARHPYVEAQPRRKEND